MPSALRFSQGRKDFPFPSRKRGFFSYHWYSRSWLWRMFACFSWWEEIGASPPSLARSQLLSVSSLPPTEELSATTIHQREWTAFSSSLWSKVTSENSTPFHPKSEVMKSKRSKTDHMIWAPNLYMPMLMLHLHLYVSLTFLPSFVHASMPSHFSRVWLFATQWTVACQAPLSIGFSRQEYWSGLLCPPPGDLPKPELEPTSLVSLALAGGSVTTGATGEATFAHVKWLFIYPQTYAHPGLPIAVSSITLYSPL